MPDILLLVGLPFGWLLGVLLTFLADDLPPVDDEPGVGAVRAPHCPACGARRSPAEASALLRLLLGRRRCRTCGASDGLRPGLVEGGLIVATAWVGIWAEGDPLRFGLGVVVLFLFALITVIDIEHRLILWRTVWVSALTLLGVAGLRPEMGFEKALWGGAVGFVLVFAMFMLGQGYAAWVARRRGQPLDEVAFGGGDVNLAALVGLTAGWPGVLFALFIGVSVGGIFAIGLVLVQLARGRYDPHQPIAYGPFLAIGALAPFFFAPLIRSGLGAG